MHPTKDPANGESFTFRTERLLPFGREAVYGAFARAEILAQWWGPKGFTNSFEFFEFKPGGRWKFVMYGPNGSKHPNESVFRELIAPSKLVIDHVAAPHYVLTITLTAHGGNTIITWNQEFEDRAFASRVRHIVEPANEQNLDRLNAVLAGQ